MSERNQLMVYYPDVKWMMYKLRCNYQHVNDNRAIYDLPQSNTSDNKKIMWIAPQYASIDLQSKL